eukprot:gb/GECH01009982.1/.p1 GENE.gb/GECH01009982.1/~~gb/GECH01009982.1/.p1  ORF type:complete len:348 (+),score=77.82 gb/GECH01009982.1/:1-1044(+)
MGEDVSTEDKTQQNENSTSNEVIYNNHNSFRKKSKTKKNNQGNMLRHYMTEDKTDISKMRKELEKDVSKLNFKKKTESTSDISNNPIKKQTIRKYSRKLNNEEIPTPPQKRKISGGCEIISLKEANRGSYIPKNMKFFRPQIDDLSVPMYSSFATNEVFDPDNTCKAYKSFKNYKTNQEEKQTKPIKDDKSTCSKSVFKFVDQNSTNKEKEYSSRKLDELEIEDLESETAGNNTFLTSKMYSFRMHSSQSNNPSEKGPISPASSFRSERRIRPSSAPIKPNAEFSRNSNHRPKSVISIKKPTLIERTSSRRSKSSINGINENINSKTNSSLSNYKILSRPMTRHSFL